MLLRTVEFAVVQGVYSRTMRASDLETADIRMLRAYVERFRTTFLSPTEKTTADVRAAINVAGSVAGSNSALQERVKQLGIPGAIRRSFDQGGPKAWNVTLEESNAEFQQAYESIVSCVDEIGALQTKILANKTLTDTHARDKALQAMVLYDREHDDKMQWSSALNVSAHLSNAQIADAIDHWAARGAIDVINNSAALSGSPEWMFKVTSSGRDIAGGDVIGRLAALSGITNITVHGPVGNLGSNYGTVSQTVYNNLPAIPDDVRSLLEESNAGSLAVEAWSDEITRAEPRQNRLQKILSTIEEVVGASSMLTEVAVHYQEWAHVVHAIVNAPH